MKLTSNILKSIVAEEVAKFKAAKSTEDAAVDAEEVDADGYGDALENHIDHYKALGLEETRLIKRLARIHEAKKVAAKKVAAKKAATKKEAVVKKTASKKK